ncbi:DNA topoisomerase 2 [Tanacetum coccineum]
MQAEQQTDSIPQNDDLVERKEETLWIWEDDEMIEKPITFVPLVYQIFDKLLISAVDRKGVKDILVKIDVADNYIRVWTHGEGVNFKYTSNKIDEAEDFLTDVSIRMGYIKPVPKEVAHAMGKKFKEFSITEKWCLVTCQINLAKFGMDCLEDDIVALMKRRVVDLAGCCSGVKVELDGTCDLPRTFQDYVQLYLQSSRTHNTMIYEKFNDSWEICVAIADGHFEHFDQVSFVNNIATTKGGSHVDYITNQITDYLAEIVGLPPNEIKRYLWVFVNAHIHNPTFDSQTKEKLTSNEGSFGSTCELTPEFLKKIADSCVFKSFDSNVGKLDIPELQDANLADTPHSQDCTLILTKGYPYTAFAMDQLYFLGQDKYGMFPLEGKLLNVREASHEELEKNTEIQNIKKILGLQEGKIYENVTELRYGHLMIMANEDLDGLEMKGLLINFLHYFWPSLLKVKNFLRAFIAPFVKATHKKTNKVFLFYSMPDYEEWKENFGEDYNIKFYKGPETIESEERGEDSFDQHIVDFVWENDDDGHAIELAFSNNKIEERKNWLHASEDGTDFDPTKKSIRYLDFIYQEFKQYAIADIQRSIPSMVDGLKPHQRKILFYAFKMPITQKTKVDQFSSYVFEHSPYNEGEASLVGTIIGMAQTFVGGNNINLLQLNGQFGTRVMGGKDHADGTLLFTWLSPITPYIFHQDDELSLNYLDEDGQSIEPQWFIPIIPMVLVNGSEARGAWSSFIPNYNPRDVIANLIRLLEGEKMLAMLPWYRGFKGDIKETKTTSSHTSYTTNGKISEYANALTITELPIRTWTKDYRKFLEEAFSRKDIKAYKDRNCTPTSVDFEITMTKDQMNRAREEEGGLLNKFNLTTTLSTDNMYLFDKNAELKKYDTPQQILQDFFHIRLDFYEKRKTDLLRHLRIDSLVLKNKLRFINEVLDGKHALVTKINTKDVKCAELEAGGFQCLASIKRKVDQLPEVAADASDTTRYDYLLSIAIQSLVVEDIEKLQQERDAKDEKIVYLKDTSIKDLWRADLVHLDNKLALEGYPIYTEGEKANRE